MQRIRDNYATSVRRGSPGRSTRWSAGSRASSRSPATRTSPIATSSIEAVFEEMDVKKPMFAKLDEVMKPGALLFSNTSALDIDQLGGDDAGGRRTSPGRISSVRPT